MAVGVVSPAVGHDWAASGGGLTEEGAAPGEEGLLGMQVEAKRAAAPVDGAPAAAEIAVEGDEEEVMEEEEEEEEVEEGDEEEEEERGDEEEEEEGDEKEEEMEDDDDDEEEEEKWVGHYSSTQSILLVGDGDFSFSLALATGFGSGANLVATSLDSYEDLGKKYSKAESNIAGLISFVATVLHGIDVKTMKLHTDLKKRRFDRIVYNFPHAGFKGKEYELRMINLHKELVKEFFRNATYLLQPYGEIHVSHKTGKWYDKWGLEDLAAEFSLILVEKVRFQKEDYPGYHQKKGDGPACDKPFPLDGSFTFKFKIGDLKKRKKRNGKRTGAILSVGGDTRPCHPLPHVEPCSGLPFVPGAYTARVPMTLVDQWQQPSMPPSFVGIPRAPYFHQPGTARSLLGIPGSSLMNVLGTPGPIPSPMGRISSTSLLAPQRHPRPRYETRIIAEPLGNNTDYFACEYKRNLVREYGMQRQLMPEGTSLNYSAFLEACQWESVQRQERLRRMIASYALKDRHPDSRVR